MKRFFSAKPLFLSIRNDIKSLLELIYVSSTNNDQSQLYPWRLKVMFLDLLRKMRMELSLSYIRVGSVSHVRIATMDRCFVIVIGTIFIFLSLDSIVLYFLSIKLVFYVSSFCILYSWSLFRSLIIRSIYI